MRKAYNILLLCHSPKRMMVYETIVCYDLRYAVAKLVSREGKGGVIKFYVHSSH